jgi:hypothetical protein
MQLFYLNITGKKKFTEKMGISSVDYGSIFLFKNDVRVYPF